MHPHESLELSSFYTNYLGPLKLLLQCCIIWLHMESVLEVVHSVLMATEHTLDITKKFQNLQTVSLTLNCLDV